MRRFTALLFLTVYFNVAWGSAFNLHFCCGHFSDISFVIFNHHSSKTCKMKNSLPDCCKDKSLLAKTDNHKTPGSIAFIEYQQKNILPIYTAEEENDFYYTQPSYINLRLHNFRNRFPKNIFLIYCNLRI